MLASAVVDAVPAEVESQNLGCVETPTVRRCFTLHKTDLTWSSAAAECGETTDGKLAVVDSAAVEDALADALTPVQPAVGSESYAAWTAGRELDQQLEWSWIGGQAFHGQRGSLLLIICLFVYLFIYYLV